MEKNVLDQINKKKTQVGFRHGWIQASVNVTRDCFFPSLVFSVPPLPFLAVLVAGGHSWARDQT